MSESCDAFHEQLDELIRGVAQEDAVQACRLHAETCVDCAVLLKLHEHLGGQSQDELEALVPSDWVRDMWSRIESEIELHGTAGGRRVQRQRNSGWLIPTLAAASLLFMVSTGYLLYELRSLRAREAQLAQQVSEHRGWLADLDRRTLLARAEQRTAKLAESNSWERLLARRGTVSKSDLDAMLASLPAESTLFSRADVERLSGRLPSRIAVWRDLLGEIEIEDGIQAGEFRQLLNGLQLDEQTRIPAARIIAMYRSEVGAGL